MLSNVVATEADGTTIVKIEPQDFKYVKKQHQVGQVKEETTTFIVHPDHLDPSTLKSISIISPEAETAALGLVSIGNFDGGGHGTNSMETQSIIVENIDLDAFAVPTTSTIIQ